MKQLLIYHLILLLLYCFPAGAQDADSTMYDLKRIPAKYIKGIDEKITIYGNRITSKTEKTLSKLSRWEKKLQCLMQKVNPDAASRLFDNNQLTFTSLLQQVRQGEAVVLSYAAPYHKYLDDITTHLHYLSQQKEQLESDLIEKVIVSHNKMQALAIAEDNTEAIQQIIKDRKKQLIDQALQYLGKNKYLTNINKEAYYYAETIRNYREIFSNPKRAEETVKTILGKIPAFNEFVKQHSMLAGLFDISPQNVQMIPGMQTTNSVIQLIQGRLSAMGDHAQEEMSKNLQSAQAQINEIKTRLNSVNSGSEMPGFKPNLQKTKTFKQRIDYGINIQILKTNNVSTQGTDIGLSMGYKLNDKSTIGVGTNYKLGLGSIRHVRFSNQGMGVRSFANWHLKKQYSIIGGFEMNYLALESVYLQVTPARSDAAYPAWQKLALIGIMKKLNIKTKWFKSAHVQLAYDFLSHQHLPPGQSVILRTGYSF